jgi:hypothetical protein
MPSLVRIRSRSTSNSAKVEDVEEHLAHRVGGVVDLATEGESDAATREVVTYGSGVGNRAGESVEFGNDECIAFA